MQKLILTALACLALVSLATPAAAHDFEVAGYYVAPYPTHVLDGEIDYSVWKETNGYDGLQQSTFRDPATGKWVPADTCELNC